MNHTLPVWKSSSAVRWPLLREEWIRVVACILALSLGLATLAAGQTKGTAQDPLAASLAAGWAALAKSDLEQARAAARRAVAADPRSAAGLALTVEVELAAAGAVPALDAYEVWLAAKKVDEPYVLRRIAQMHLQTVVRQRNAGPARVAALKGLAQDGDQTVLASLSAAAETGAETEILASLGDGRAVKRLIERLGTVPSKQATIEALAASGSRDAVPPLLEILKGGNEFDRAAAADALGRLGATEAVPHLKPLLTGGSFPLRLSAAGALYRLEDESGTPLLEELMASEHSQVRLAAAKALSVRPVGTWIQVVRALTSDPDEAVQLGAATLIAPHDRELAESVLGRLTQSGNMAIREEAARAVSTRVANDFRTLRVLLRNPDALISVQAATRILELTR